MPAHDQPTEEIQALPPEVGSRRGFARGRAPAQVLAQEDDRWAAPGLPPEPGGGPVPARRGRRAATTLLRLGLLLVAAALALVAAALLVTPPRESLLIMGSDARPDELQRGAVGRTDTLLLLVADRATPRVAMVSVPRDLWTAIPGYGEERVNAAYELGGPQTAKQTISNLLGVRVDRYAVVGLQGVRDIVDAIGGIDITVPQPIHDSAYPTDTYGTIVVDIPAGRQHMDGETALRYARTRHQDSDFGRIARQQQVVAAVRAAMMNPLNWPRLPATLAAIQRSVKTDVSPLDAMAVAAALLRAPGPPDRLVVDTTLVEPFTGEGGAYLLRVRPGLRQAVARFLGTAQPRVEVLNGAGEAGLARATADRLARQGIAVASIGDATRAQARTTIETRPDGLRVAESVARALNLSGGRLVQTEALPAGVDIRIIVGADLAR